MGVGRILAHAGPEMNRTSAVYLDVKVDFLPSHGKIFGQPAASPFDERIY
jgi:hypothetical protein